MSKFNGFTQDEIHSMNSELAKKTNVGAVRKHIKRTNSDTKTADKLAKSDINQNKNAQENATSSKDTSSLSDSTIQAFQDAFHYRPISQNQRAPHEAGDHSNKPNDANTAENNKNNNGEITHDIEKNPDTRSLFQGISLKDFEKHQQLMKEANLEKRRLLSQAIEKRFEQSIAEATKIAKIREELEKLDQELATDVEILRKEIEAVTLQYAATRENYHQIESQFLAAKMNLHQVSEKKELLTEHLCTIISHNEDRKAKKLSELLNKVGLATDENSSVSGNDATTKN